MEESISLSELAKRIELGLKQSLQPLYWIVAEISECSVNSKGHCFLELIEKPEDKDNPTAKMRATIWATTYRMLSAYFESETGCCISVGMKIMIQVSVDFNSVYGLNLNIKDINPTYTIGEDELQRKKIIRQLEEDGTIDMNKNIPLPAVIQRIAIISSETAAGYRDFIQQLTNNQYNIHFETTLFNASMQGVEVENSIIKQLDNIYSREDDFDVVAIIRGGGARADLRWFDNYKIATNIAQFTLPVITGIGHDKDQSIADIVANTSVKTPTAVAEFIISHNQEFIFNLNSLQERLQEILQNEIQNRRNDIQETYNKLLQACKIRIIQSQNVLNIQQQSVINAAQNRLTKESNKLELLNNSLEKQYEKRITKEKNALQLFYTLIQSKNPETILKQGYTLTTNSEGNILHSKSQVQKDDTLLTHFADGTISSTVN